MIITFRPNKPIAVDAVSDLASELGYGVQFTKMHREQKEPFLQLEHNMAGDSVTVAKAGDKYGMLCPASRPKWWADRPVKLIQAISDKADGIWTEDGQRLSRAEEISVYAHVLFLASRVVDDHAVRVPARDVRQVVEWNNGDEVGLPIRFARIGERIEPVGVFFEGRKHVVATPTWLRYVVAIDDKDCGSLVELEEGTASLSLEALDKLPHAKAHESMMLGSDQVIED